MFAYTLEKESFMSTGNPDDKRAVVQDVVDLFTSWDTVRTKQKNIADKLHSEIYLDDRKKTYVPEDDEWKSDIHLNKIYSLFQTHQAYIWDNIYSNVENMFDVEGIDDLSAQTALLQKQKLVNTFYNIGIIVNLFADRIIGISCFTVFEHKTTSSYSRNLIIACSRQTV